MSENYLLKEAILAGKVSAVENLVKSGFPLDYPHRNGSYLQLATKNPQLFHLLLYYNAQIYDDSAVQCFALTCNPRIRQVLFDYIFDGYASIPLDVILNLIRRPNNQKSDLISKIISGTCNIYKDDSWDDLYHDLELFKSEDFELLLEKFPRVVLKAVINDRKDCSILCLARFISHQWIRDKIARNAIYNLHFLLTNNEIVLVLVNQVNEPWICLLAPLPLELLEMLVYQALSVGFDIYDVDLNAIFKTHGWCELFRHLLHMEARKPDQNYVNNLIKVGYLSEGKYDYITPLIYEVDCTVQEFARKSRTIRCVYRFEHLLDFTNLCAFNRVEVPSLVELARNATRQHLIDYYKINKSWQYQFVIKKLFLPQIIKEILMFERKVYQISKICPDSLCLICYDRHFTYKSSSYSSSSSNKSSESDC